MNITYEEYFNFTPTTAQYGNNEIYPVLELIGETLETMEAMEFWRDEHNTFTKSLAIKELGDMCWPMSQICHHKDISFEGLFLSSYHDDFEDNNWKIVRLALKTLAEQSKKIIRDGKSEKRIVALSIAMSILAEFIRWNCGLLGCTIEEILMENKNKLTDRLDRGTIQGDGDNR